MLRIGALVSGGGTNLQAIIDAVESGYIKNASLTLVISNKSDAFALQRAAKHKIKTKVITSKGFANTEMYSKALADAFKADKVELILLAGFMAILGASFFADFKNKVMNIHPALIPSFSGPGYYGLKVHKAVLEYGCKVTGASVHFVTPEVDAGPLIIQKAVSVQPGDTAEMLQRRVMEQAEWEIYPEAVRLFAEGRLCVKGRQVQIKMN